MELPLPPGAYGATDPLFLLLAALALEAYVGDVLGRLPRVPHPRALVVRVARVLERKLNRPTPERWRLMTRGGVVAGAIVLLVALLGLGLALLTRAVPYLWLFELLVLVAFFGQRATGRRAAGVLNALEAHDLARAHGKLSALTGELLDPNDVPRMGERDVGLAAVAGLGERFGGTVVAPAFWYVLLGLPGILAQQALHSYAVVVATSNRPGGGGYRRGAEGDFAFVPVRLDAALTWLPDKLAGLMLALASVFVPTTYPGTAFRRLRRGHYWSVAALGGALRLAAKPDARLSPAAAPDARQVGRALGLFAVGCLIHAGVIAVLLVLRQLDLSL
jgi:adenosylcobinamide-phosphate synthase